MSRPWYASYGARLWREAWADASPFSYWRHDPADDWVSRVLTILLGPVARLVERGKAARMMIRPDDPRAVYHGWPTRLHCLLLVCLPLPVRWTYPEYRTGWPGVDQVAGWDEARYGGENDCWEATFIAVGPWWRPAYIYREGGP